MNKSTFRLFTSLIITGFLILLLDWNTVSAYAPDADTQSKILYVKPGANGTCSSWADACELQTALSTTVTGDQIWVAAGTYKPTTLSNREATFQLKNGVAIYGSFPAAGGEMADRNWETNITTLSGDIGLPSDSSDNSFHVVTGSGVDATAVLDGFTISLGNANGTYPNNGGGGMYNEGGSPTLINITFKTNFATDQGGGMSNVSGSSPSLSNVTISGNSVTLFGGGMYNDYSSSPSLNNVTFSGNSADYGGGMCNGGSNPTLSDVTFSGNTALNGGGMYNESSSPNLINVTFSNNTADFYGGGMYNGTSSNPTLNDVTFSSNTAIDGGGMFNRSSSSPRLTNVIFSGNSADYGGGGISNENSSPSLTYITFSENTATDCGEMNNYNSSPSLTNVTFSGNSATEYGGGMCISGSNPTLSNVTFSGNTAFTGGGIYNYNSSLSLSNVTFSDNYAINFGGGMYNSINCIPTLSDVTFSSNTAGNGGGMYNYGDGNPSLSNVTFSDNIATDSGGGMYNDYSSPSFINVTFSSNSAFSGGGVYNYNGSSPSFINVTFSGNTATDSGGGMYNFFESNPSLINVTFSGNIATSVGGGINNNQSRPTVTNAILWGNTPDQLNNIYQGSAYVTYSDIQGGYVGTGNIDTDPLLGSLADNGGFTQTHALIEGSPAIDSGDTMICPVIDQRAYTRPIDGDGNGIATCDMGAYEYASYPATFSLTLDIVGMGSVLKEPDKTEYLWGEVVTLTSVADPNWVFIGWEGDASGSSSQVIVRMTDNLGVTANFAQIEYSLSVSVNPPGMGTVTNSPDKPYYHYGDTVTLTANSTVTGWRFIGWSGNASGAENPLQVTITGNTNITANFSNQYTLATIVDPSDSGTITRDPYQDAYIYGTQVVLTATPSLGWTFAGWGGDASGSDNPLTYTIIGDTSITATFTQDEYTLAVDISPVESGMVLISPMQTTYHYGDEVTLTSVANSGWTFLEWSGDATGSDNPLTVTIHGDTNITANFMQDQYTLDVTIEGFGSVAIDPVQATYIYGTEVTLTATADPSWRFVGWSGDASGSDNPLIFTIQGNTSITALFTTNWIFLPMITR